MACTSGLALIGDNLISGCCCANTRKISSAKAWPMFSTPLKSKITVLNFSMRVSTRLAWDRDTKASFPYWASDTGTTVLEKAKSSSEANWSNIDLRVCLAWRLSFMATEVPSRFSFRSKIQSSSSPNLWENATLPDNIQKLSKMREVKKIPSPLCRDGSVVNFPLANSRTDSLSSNKFREFLIFLKMPSPSSMMAITNAVAVRSREIETEVPLEWSIALFSISVKP